MALISRLKSSFHNPHNAKINCLLTFITYNIKKKLNVMLKIKLKCIYFSLLRKIKYS